MDNNQIQQEISIIKSMIEKTRREAAENGHFFIIVGFLAVINTLAIGIMQSYSLNYLVLPALITTMAAAVLIGYLTAGRQEKKDKVKSYPKTICYNVMLACGISGIMIIFLFPLIKVYPWNLVPVLTSLIMGIIVFSTGVIFEVRLIKLSSTAWWIGSFMMAIYEGQQWPSISIMTASIVIGFILPGYILNKNYKNRSKENEE